MAKGLRDLGRVDLEISRKTGAWESDEDVCQKQREGILLLAGLLVAL